MKLSIKIKRNLNNWIDDRIEDEEPLMLDRFYSFMRELGYSVKELSFLKNKTARKEIKKDYKDKKAAYIKGRYIFR